MSRKPLLPWQRVREVLSPREIDRLYEQHIASNRLLTRICERATGRPVWDRKRFEELLSAWYLLLKRRGVDLDLITERYLASEFLDEIDWLSGTTYDWMETKARILAQMEEKAKEEGLFMVPVEMTEEEAKYYEKLAREEVEKQAMELGLILIEAKKAKKLERLEELESKLEKARRRIRTLEAQLEAAHKKLEAERKKRRVARVEERKPRIKYLWIKFLEPVERFTGVDGVQYGPYGPGDVAKIPAKDAEKLLKTRMATADLKAKITKRPKPKPKAPPTIPPEKREELQRLWDQFMDARMAMDYSRARSLLEKFAEARRRFRG